MRRLFLALAATVLASWIFGASTTKVGGTGTTKVGGTGTTKVASGAQAAAYFGGCNSDGTPLSVSGNEFWNNTGIVVNSGTGVTYTCPGTGSRTVDAIAFYAKSESGGATPSNGRMAVYTNDATPALVFQGSAQLSVTSAGYDWQSTGTFTGTPTLTGGTVYKVFVSADDSDTRLAYATTTNGGGISYGTDYTGGFPGTATAGSSANKEFIVRIHVE